MESGVSAGHDDETPSEQLTAQTVPIPLDDEI